MINFGRPAPPGKGVCGGEIFGFALLQPARSVCVSVSVFFILHCDANATVSWVGSIIIIVVVVFINYLRQVGYVFVGVS